MMPSGFREEKLSTAALDFRLCNRNGRQHKVAGREPAEEGRTHLCSAPRRRSGALPRRSMKGFSERGVQRNRRVEKEIAIF